MPRNKARRVCTIVRMSQGIALEWGTFVYTSRKIAQLDCDWLNKAGNSLHLEGCWQVIEYGRPMFIDKTFAN